MRSYTPLVLGLVLVVPFGRRPLWRDCAAAVAVMAAGLAIRLWSVMHATGGTRTRSAQTHALCTVGPYALCRNPLYVANILIYGAAAWLFSLSAVWMAAAVLLFAAQYYLIVRYEESQCRQIFGGIYERYRAEVPRWIPRAGRGALNAENVKAPPIESFGGALRHEWHGIASVLVVLILFWLKCRLSF